MGPQLISYVQSETELESCLEMGAKEVILGVAELSRFGQLRSKEALELAKKCRESGLRCVLEWDILMTQHRFEAVVNILKRIDFNLFDAVRVQDPGAFEYALELCRDHSHLKVQLSLESGNHNLVGIEHWVKYGGERLERISLSIELPKQKMIEIASKVSCPVEVLGLGRILLFYTPRALVSPLAPNKTQERIEVTGSSQESPHSGFPIVENQHGTFMFHLADHCLLEDMEELCYQGIEHFRIDTRFYPQLNLSKPLRKLTQSFAPEHLKEIKSQWPVRLIQGFFRTNRSDVLFKKLKNSRLQNRDESFLGDVVEAQKGSHLAVMVKSQGRKLQQGHKLRIQTPDGLEKSVEVRRIWNAMGETLESAAQGQIAFIDPVNAVSVRSMVYFSE